MHRERVQVGDLMMSKFTLVRLDEPLNEVILKIAADRETMIACVVDDDEVLKGIITPLELLRAVEVRDFGVTRYRLLEGREMLRFLNLKYARDIMSAPICVRRSDGVDLALEGMVDRCLFELPVVDEQNKVIGEIHYFDIITHHAVEHL